MAEEFKIRTKIDIDDSEARKKLANFKSDSEKDPLSLKIDLDNSNNKISDIRKNLKDAFSLDKTTLKNLKTVQNALKEINSLSKENSNKLFNSLNSNASNSNNITDSFSQKTQSDLLSMYRNISNTIDALKKQLNKGIGENAVESTVKEISRLESELDKIKSNLSTSSKLELFDVSRTNRDLVTVNKSLSGIEGTVDKLDSKIKSVNFDNINLDKITILKNELKDLKEKLGSDLRLDIDIGSTRNRLNEIYQEIKNLEKVENLSSNFSKIESSIKEAFGESYVASFRNELSLLESLAHNLDGSFDRAFDGLNNNLRESTREINRLTRESRDMSNSLSDGWNNFANSISAYSIGDMLADGIVDSIRGIKDVILEVDGAMTNLKKVADSSDISSSLKLKNIKNEAVEVSKQVGMSVSDVISGIASSLQAGMGSMEESIKVARGAMILANTGDMSQESASSGLNTIINSFKIEPLKEMQVQVGNTMQKTNQLTDAMDKLNHASNNYAVTTQDLIDGFSNGGSVLANYGVSIGDAAAMITSANLSLQDGSRVGNGIKSISVNLASMKTNAKDGSMEINKTAKGLKEIAGIEVYSDKSKGEVKGMITILDELHKKWGSLKKDQQFAISESIAGKQQATVFQSLMQNYDSFIKIRQEFEQGIQFGSSENENSQYIDSISGKLNHLASVWTSISTTVINSDFIKTALDGFIALSEGIDSVIQILDKFNLSSSVAIGAVGGLFSAIKTSVDASKLAKETNNVANEVRNVSNEAGNLADEVSDVAASTSDVANGTRSVTNNVQRTVRITDRLKGSIAGAGKFLGNFLKQGLLIGGITFVIQALAKSWDWLTNSVKNNIEELNHLEQGQLDTISASKEKINVLQTIGKKYEELANKANKTSEEEEKMLELGNELAKVLPEIQIGTDENGNAIISMTTDMQGYIDKTSEAIDQQERLLLGTRLDQSDAALKMLTKGEVFGKDRLGLNEQKINIQKEYNNTMKDLEDDYLAAMINVRNKNGKEQKDALAQARKIKEDMIRVESEYGNKYSEVQSRIMQQSSVFKETMDSIWKDSASLLISDLTPEMEKSIQSFTNSIDFSEIDSEEELDSVKRIFREIPKLAQDGTISIDTLNTQISDINNEFARTGSVEDYTRNMKALAESVSAKTGWDVSVLEEMFTVVSDGTLKSSSSLENFLKSFGKTTQQLKNGDNVAKELQKQFVAIEDTINTINNHDFSSEMATYQLRVDLQTDENLPLKVRDMIRNMSNLGVKDDVIITLTGEVMMALKDGEIDTSELEILKYEVDSALEGALGDKYTQDIQIQVHGYLESLNKDDILKDIENNIQEGSVTKEITYTTNGAEDVKTADEYIKIIESRPDVLKEVKAVVEGEDDLVLFGEIIDKLPVGSTHTDKFIVDNKDALKNMKTYQEVLDFINKQPKEFKVKYGFITEGLDNTADKIENLTQKTNEEKTVEIKTNDEEVLNSIEDIESLIKLSAKVGDGKYKLDIEANTENAIVNIDNFKLAINNLSNQLDKIPTTNIDIKTSTSAQNISGLKTRIQEFIDLSKKVKTLNFSTNTTTASKNVTGLKNNVSSYIKAYAGKTFSTRFNCQTALASQNVTGLRNNISSYISSYAGKTFTTKLNVVTNKVTTGSTANKGDSGSPASIESVVKGRTVSESAINTSALNSNVRGEVQSETSTQVIAKSIARKTQSTPISIGGSDISSSMKYSVELLKELENRISRVNDQLSVLDKKMERATGSEKIKYLEQQNSLYKEQIAIQKELEDKLIRQKNYYEYFLKNKGFKFNSDGNLTNYEEKLLAMEKEVAKLEEKANGKNSSDSTKKKYDDAKKNLDEVKKYLDEYIQVAFTDLPKVEQEFLDINNALQDNIDAIQKFKDELKELKYDSKFKDEDRDIKDVQNKIDKTDILLETAVGKEQVKLLQEKVKLQEQLKKETADMLNYETKRRNDLMKELGEYGFSFRDDGSIEQYGSKIEQLKKDLSESEFDKVFSKIEDYLDTTYDKIPGIEKDILNLNDSLLDTMRELEQVGISQIDKDIEKASEEELLGLLTKKKGLQEELALKKKEYVDLLNEEANKEKEFLSKQGFKFNDDGSLNNFEQKIKELQGTINSTKDAQKKNGLEKELENIIKVSQNYVKVTESEIPKAVEEWKNAQYEVKQTKEEIEELEKAEIKFQEDKAEAIKKATEGIMKVTQDLLQTQMDINKKHIDMIEKSMKLASFDPKESYEALQKQIDLLEKQKELQSQMGEELEKQKNYYKDQLVTFGIEFDSSGVAKNAESILNNIKKQMSKASSPEELEKLEKKFNDIVSVLGDYNSALESVVDNQGNLADIQLEIQGVYENMLQTTKKIEDKITAILQKQVEERKKLIDEELKKRLDSLKKEQDAYNKKKEEDKYNKNYEEKLKEINELQAKIEAVKKDSSLSGQAKLEELLKELADKQEEFDEMVQDKLDKEINEKFEEEQDRLQEEADNKKEELDQKLEKEELSDVIKDALETGKLQDIDGNIIDLKDAILEYEDKYGDGLSVIGGLIKKDLLGQLDISLDTMKNIEKILKELNISELSSRSMPQGILHPMSTYSNPASSINTINFNESLITVQGNVTSDVMPELKSLIKQAEREITRNIIKSM